MSTNRSWALWAAAVSMLGLFSLGMCLQGGSPWLAALNLFFATVNGGIAAHCARRAMRP